MEDVQSLVQECAILKDISDHPNIVKLHEVYHVAGGNKLNMVMDVVRGGTLFEAIVDSPAEYLTERFTARIMAGCCSALAFMHKKGIAHRDIKPENIMLLPKADRDRGDFVELCDFGFARLFDEAAGMMMSTCGTPEYVAPEVLKHTGYSASCDVWSMGVVLYVMLSGYTPFYSDNTSKLFKQIMNGKFQMPASEWGAISDDAKDLVRQMLTVDPHKRITAKGSLQHPWIVKNLPEHHEEGAHPHKPLHPELQTHVAKYAATRTEAVGRTKEVMEKIPGSMTQLRGQG